MSLNKNGLKRSALRGWEEDLESCTYRLFCFGDVLHLNMQIFDLNLHRFTSLDGSRTGELRLLQLKGTRHTSGMSSISSEQPNALLQRSQLYIQSLYNAAVSNDSVYSLAVNASDSLLFSEKRNHFSILNHKFANWKRHNETLSVSLQLFIFTLKSPRLFLPL